MKLELSSTVFRKNSQISNLIKIGLVGAELFHADGQTNRHDEANSRFSQFCERTQKHTINQQLPPADNLHPSTKCGTFSAIELYASVPLRWGTGEV